MSQNNNINTIVLLVILLIITNLKPILVYREWIHFRIHTISIQYKKERKNKINFRTQNLRCKLQYIIQKIKGEIRKIKAIFHLKNF